MAFTLPTAGTLNWDIPLNTLLAEGANKWIPDDYGFLTWSIDPSQAANSNVLTSGTVYMVRVHIRQTASVSNVALFVNNTPTLTAGQNFAGVYNASGARVGVTADQSAAWATAGAKTAALTASFVASPGPYYVAILSNGATPIDLPRESNLANAGLLNFGQSIATSRSTTGPTAQTTLPVSITMGTRTPSGISPFVALS